MSLLKVETLDKGMNYLTASTLSSTLMHDTKSKFYTSQRIPEVCGLSPSSKGAAFHKLESKILITQIEDLNE